MRITVMTALTMLALLPCACFAAPDAAASAPPADPRPDAVSAAQIDGMSSRMVDLLWARTDYFWHRGDYPRVVALDRVITEADPHFLEPYSTGGWLMESLGHNHDAEAYYSLGVTKNPDEAYLRHQLGIFYFNTLKDYPKAITAFLGATQQKDADINCWKMLAHSYEKNQEYPKALVVWQKLNQQHPNDGIIIHNLQRVQAHVAAQSASASQAAPSQ